MSTEEIEIDVQKPSLDIHASGIHIVGVEITGIFYSRPQLTGQTISYANNDDGWNLANGVYTQSRPDNPINIAELDPDAAEPFTTLKELNAFGVNKNRFTDSVGGQDYDGTGGSLVDYIIDHLTGRAWYRVAVNEAWATSLVSATASTQAGFSDWWVPNIQEMLSISQEDAGLTTTRLNYSPFNFSLGVAFWTGTTVSGATTSAHQYLTSQSVDLFQPLAKSNSRRYFKIRNHYS